MKSKTLFDGEWVKVRPMLNKNFAVGANQQCSMCKRCTCAPMWWSITRKKYRCTSCFTPEVLR